MSAGNYIRIKQYEQKPLYRVSEQVMCFEPNDDDYFGSADTLDRAARLAAAYDEKEFVEYGIKIVLLR